jgi:hypothetical protein
METIQPDTISRGVAEAVIISGPRRGEIITLSEGQMSLSAEEEAALDALIADAKRMAESARAARIEAEAVLQTLRQMGEAQ